jgi:hypothetical protein
MVWQDVYAVSLASLQAMRQTSSGFQQLLFVVQS